MTRRIRKAVLGAATLVAVVYALTAPAPNPDDSAPADGRWLAVSKAVAAVHQRQPTTARRGAGLPRAVVPRVAAAPPVPQPPPLLLPGSAPYRRTGSASVALTFDDGPDPTWTPQVLKLLRKYHIKATFCVIGVNVRSHPELVRKIAADGHALCNHTMHHDEHLKDKSRAAILSDMRQTSALITKASGGVKPAYFRAPGGNWGPNVVSVARSLGMASVGWQVDPRDWTKPPSGTIVARVRLGTKPGSIILMHDGGGDRSRSVSALRKLLPGFTRKYHLVRL